MQLAGQIVGSKDRRWIEYTVESDNCVDRGLSADLTGSFIAAS